MRHFVLVPILCAAALVLSVKPAAAQFIGTFSWQSAPYCNIITLNVTQIGSAYALDGFDNLCGAERRAPVTGTATLNANGTVELGLAVVNAPTGEPNHIDVVINVATLGGPWSDSTGHSGAFVFNGAGGGSRRPSGQVTVTTFNTPAYLIGRRASGTAEAPTAVGVNDQIVFIGARGHVGTAFTTSSDGYMQIVATQNWTSTARGTRIEFATTPTGSTTTSNRMRIDQDGQVGIGLGGTAPLNLLDVNGNIRVGSANGCVIDRDGDVIAGACASDARFKRDISSFGPMLSKVAALRPVHFYWRKNEFPALGFGSQQSFGLMAQEVEEILPDLVTTDAEGFKAVNYSKLPLLALQAIKELKEKNDALESQNAEFERRLAELEARLKP
jgi:hypothetical protein